MKKIVFINLSFLFIIAFAVTNVVLNSNNGAISNISLANIEALAAPEDYGSQYHTQATCQAANCYWNTMLQCSDGGIEPITCEVSGKLVILGFEISGSYTKGNQYTIVWDRFSCETSSGNCCQPTSQGIWVGTTKIG